MTCSMTSSSVPSPSELRGCSREIGCRVSAACSASTASTSMPIRRPISAFVGSRPIRSEEHTSELQSQSNLVCRLLLEKKKRGDKHGFRLLAAARCRRRGASPCRIHLLRRFEGEMVDDDEVQHNPLLHATDSSQQNRAG